MLRSQDAMGVRSAPPVPPPSGRAAIPPAAPLIAIPAGEAVPFALTRSLRRRLALALMAARPRIVEAWARSQLDRGRLRRFGVDADGLGPDRELARGFLAPLLELLRAWIRTGEPRYADVYLDERLRYAPHQADPAQRSAFFREVIPLDEAPLLAAAAAARGPGRDALVEPLRALLAELHGPLLEPPPGRPFRLLALGDCLMNELRVGLTSRCRAEGFPLDFRGQYFSALYGAGLSVAPVRALLRGFAPDLVAFSFLSYKGLAPYAALMAEAGRLRASDVRPRVDAVVRVMRDFLLAVRELTDATFLVHNASGLPLAGARRLVPLAPPLSRGRRHVLRALDAAVRELVAATPKALLLDEAEVARRHGLRACEARVVPRWVVPFAEFHTARFGEFLSPAYADVLASHRALSRCKVLAVDFDNTLWRGVMAEGPVEQDHALQRTLRRLKEAGVVLVAVSKNDPANIRWQEMTLQPDDFVLHKVSWDLKAGSLAQAAQELDLGLDAFVLLDDNPAERELVRSALPEVATLDPLDPRTGGWLERMLAFPNTRDTEEARARTELYRAQAARKAALRPDLDPAALMAQLELRAEVRPAAPGDLPRLAELALRTNQFNTTTIRYSAAQLAELSSDPAVGVYAGRLADKFGDLGLVALAVVRRAGAARTIDDFVMSCRAMGFGFEALVLRRVLEAEGAPEVRVVGRFLPTPRNGPASTLYPTAGFAALPEGGFVLEAGAPLPEAPGWFNRPD